MIWTTCPACGWSYEMHGDTHMSTRFHCWRSRNTSRGAAVHEPAPVETYTGPTCSEAVAGYQQETIKAIMAEQGLNFGPACDVHIATHHYMLLHSI